MPRVVTAARAGVCFGVKRAVALLEEALALGAREQRPVFMLGPLIHNPRFIAQCSDRGAVVTNLAGILFPHTTIRLGSREYDWASSFISF